MSSIAALKDLFFHQVVTGNSIDRVDTAFNTQRDYDLNRALSRFTFKLPSESVVSQCLALIDRVGKYIIGEFDVHNDEQLLELWEPLIKGWYFGRVWIIKSEEVMQLEISLAESEQFKNSIPEHKLYRGNPFRLFEKYSDDKGRVFYRSLLTGIDAFELDAKELISISNDDGQSFYMWWTYIMDYLAGKSRVIESFKAASKTVSVTIRNKDNFENESSQMENPSIFFKTYRNTGGTALEQNIYQEMPLIDTVRVKDLLDINEELFKKATAFLGFTANSNEKRERLTVAENYKDLRQVTNIQDAQLKSLKVFENKLKEKNWVKESCRIEMAGLTFAQGLPNAASELSPEQPVPPVEKQDE